MLVCIINRWWHMQTDLLCATACWSDWSWVKSQRQLSGKLSRVTASSVAPCLHKLSKHSFWTLVAVCECRTSVGSPGVSLAAADSCCKYASNPQVDIVVTAFSCILVSCVSWWKPKPNHSSRCSNANFRCFITLWSRGAIEVQKLQSSIKVLQSYSTVCTEKSRVMSRLVNSIIMQIISDVIWRRSLHICPRWL